MFKIKLFGSKEDVYVTDAQGRAIKTKWEDKSVPNDTKFSGKSFGFEKGQIKYIFHEPDSVDKNQKNAEHRAKLNKEYTENTKQFTNQTPEQKANSTLFMSYFNFLFRNLYGDEPNQDTVAEAVEYATEWYKDNPYRKYPDPSIFKMKYETNEIGEKNLISGFLPESTKANRFGMNIVENIIHADRREARFLDPNKRSEVS